MSNKNSESPKQDSMNGNQWIMLIIIENNIKFLSKTLLNMMIRSAFSIQRNHKTNSWIRMRIILICTLVNWTLMKVNWWRFLRIKLRTSTTSFHLWQLIFTTIKLSIRTSLKELWRNWVIITPSKWKWTHTSWNTYQRTVWASKCGALKVLQLCSLAVDKFICLILSTTLFRIFLVSFGESVRYTMIRDSLPHLSIG